MKFYKPILPLVFFLSLGLYKGAVQAADNPFYPPSCGNPGLANTYTVKKYLRFSTSRSTAERNVLLTPDDGDPTDKRDTHDILAGLPDPDTNGGNSISLYTDTVTKGGQAL